MIPLQGNNTYLQGSNPYLQGGAAGNLQGGAVGLQGTPAPVVKPSPAPASLKNTMTTPAPAPEATPAGPSQPQTSSPSPSMGSVQSEPTMEPGGMAKYLDIMRDKLKANNGLAEARGLLVTALYDRPLSAEEAAKLPPSVAKAIEGGDKRDIELQIRLLNDQIKGRTNTLDQSVEFLTKSYETDLARADEQRQTAIDNVLQFAQVYGEGTGDALRSLYGDAYVEKLKGMGIDVDTFGGIQTLKEKQDAAFGAGLTPAQINATVNSIAGAFDNEPIVKNYNTIKQNVDAYNNLGSSATDDIQRIYTFAKVADPNSAVKEGEYQSIEKYAQALLQRTGLRVSRVFTATGVLTPEAREAMGRTLQTQLDASQRAYSNVANEYQRQIDDAYSGRGRQITDYQGGGGSDADPLGLFSSVGKTSGSTPYLSTLGAVTGANGSSLWSYGLDVDLKIGDPVVSPVNGVVIAAAPNGGFGNQVKIRADDGNEIWLSHLSKGGVKVGQRVTAGQKVALGGNTGNTIPGKGGDGSHLDITMKSKDGKLFSAPQVQKYLTNKYV